MVAPNWISNEDKIQSIDIYNLLGEKIYSEILFIEAVIQPVDIVSQPSGIYFVQIKSENKIYNQKIVKQ